MKKPNVLLVIPRYFSTKEYGYVMPLGILYVSAALKYSNVANVYTLNLNHCADDDETILRNWLETYSIDIVEYPDSLWKCICCFNLSARLILK